MTWTNGVWERGQKIIKVRDRAEDAWGEKSCKAWPGVGKEITSPEDSRCQLPEQQHVHDGGPPLADVICGPPTTAVPQPQNLLLANAQTCRRRSLAENLGLLVQETQWHVDCGRLPELIRLPASEDNGATVEVEADAQADAQQEAEAEAEAEAQAEADVYWTDGQCFAFPHAPHIKSPASSCRCQGDDPTLVLSSDHIELSLRSMFLFQFCAVLR